MDTSFKISSIAEISRLVETSKRQGNTIVHCHGEFDLLHLGHMRYFKAARQMGDILVVTLTPDRFIAKGPGRPVFNEKLRAEAIANLEYVNYVGINEWPTAAETLKIIKPDIYVKGSEYLNKVDVTGRLEKEKAIVESQGGKMAFSHEIIFSSSKLLNNHFNVFTNESQQFLSEIAAKYDSMSIVKSLDSLKSKKILLLGEVRRDDIQELSLSFLDQESSGVINQMQMENGILSGVAVLSELCNELDVICFAGEDYLTQEPTFEKTKQFICVRSGKSIYPNSTVIQDEETGYCIKVTINTLQLSNGSIIDSKVKEILENKIESYDNVIVIDQGIGLLPSHLTQRISDQANHLTVSLSSLFFGRQDLKKIGNKYKNIDLLCMGNLYESGAINDGDIDEFITEFDFRDDLAKAVLCTRKKGIAYLNQTNLSWIPHFIDNKTKRFPFDYGAALSAMLGPISNLGLDDDIIKLLGNAYIALAEEKQPNQHYLNRMQLDKFIISLLNR